MVGQFDSLCQWFGASDCASASSAERGAMAAATIAGVIAGAWTLNWVVNALFR